MQDFSLYLALKYVSDSISSILCTSIKKDSQFFYVLQNKSNCFGTLELDVVIRIVILLHYDCANRFYIVLFLRSN